MTERGTGGRWYRATLGLRARTLALVVSGAIVAGVGIAYLRRRRQNHQQQNQPNVLGGRETTDTREKGEVYPSEKDGQSDAEAGPARAMVGRKELDSYAPETSKEKIAPAAVTEWSEISSRIVHARGNFQPITLGLSSVTLPLGTAPRENVLQQKQLEGSEFLSAAAGAVTDEVPPSWWAGQGLYLTSTGPNHDLLKKMSGEGAAGGFGDVTFWKTVSGQEMALKTAKDTASGRRQQRREIEFLIDFKCLHPDAANIVGVVEARIAPFDMLLMRKESQTLTSMLESAISIDVVAIAKVLFGILTAIDLLHEAGFVQRDIKGDNMLVGEDGSGILADFGLCIANADACLPEFLGDGTAEYAAPEITSKLTGSTLCTELYSWFVVFAESVMMRHPFAGEELFDARNDRLEYLEEKRTYMIEDVDDLTEELERLLGGEEGNAGEGEGEAEGMSLEEQRLQLQEELATLQSKLEAVRIQEWEMASGEAKANPSKLFEGDDWVEWLPGPSRADCKQGVKLAVNFVVGEGALHPDPESRPQDVEAARGVLTEAVALYEQQRQRENVLEQGEGARGAPREDSGAGG